jgi:hypothetical protein
MIRAWRAAPLAPFISLFTFHFSPILPDARLVEPSQPVSYLGRSCPGRPTLGLLEAFCALYERGFVRGDFSKRQIQGGCVTSVLPAMGWIDRNH